MIRNIKLRDPEDSDIPFLLKIENDLCNNQLFTTKWRFYSENDVKYFVQKKQNLLMNLQYRFMITYEFNSIGCLDLIDFDLLNSRVELGIFIDEKYRKNGFAFNALEEIKNKIHHDYSINQIYVEILSDNIASINFFKKSGFQKTGCKKKWIRKENDFLDLHLYQFFFNT